MKPSEAKEIADSLREFSQYYGEFGKALKAIADETKRLKRLIGSTNLEAEAKGSKLIAVGLALIAFPDPTITDAVGATLVAAGLLKNKMRESTVVDVYREFHETFKKVASLSSDLGR